MLITNIARAFLAFSRVVTASRICETTACATHINFAPEDILEGEDGLEPHPLQPFRYGKPVYPVTKEGNGLEMNESHLSYWEGKYFMYSATWGCGGSIFVYANPPDNEYPPSPVYPPGDYGADGNCGIKTYSSPDLTNWRLENFYQPLSTIANVTKPVVRYSNSTGKYVMFMGGAGLRGIYYATSVSPSGPWSSPPGILQGQYLSHDFEVFETPDGTHYIVTDPFAGRITNFDQAVPTWDIWVQQLEPNLTATANTPDTMALVRSASQLIAQNLSLEAAGAFYKDGHYYLTFGMTCQNCAGYIYYYHSTSPLGPYQDGGFLSLDGCGGQNKGVNVLPTPNNGTVVVASVLSYRTSQTNYVFHQGPVGYIWHGDNQQAASSTFLFPIEFMDNHTIKPFTCASRVRIPLMTDTGSLSSPPPYQLDCRIRNWQNIEISYAQAKESSILEFPGWQRTDNLGPTTNAGPALDGPLEIVLTYANGLNHSFTWPSSNISWAPAKISMDTSYNQISKITLKTNATNGCYGTIVKPKTDLLSSYGACVLGVFSEKKRAELYVYQWQRN
ncbi:hypothetical protein DPV78_011591 [Talaromyces pinophilus]|nr:hypothetical protein DPV78_011591 [Talaromyces pinophilus]